MTPKDDLFLLIRSLSKAEKTTFSKAASGGGKKAPLYLQLFQAINESEAKSDEEFLRLTKGKAFERNFPVRKNELFAKILQMMRAQRQTAGVEKPIEFQVRENLEDIRFLREKKLYDLAWKALKQAREDAETYQFHEILLEILKLERSIVLDAQAQGFVDRVFKLHEEIALTADIIKNKYRTMSLRDKLFLPTRQHLTLSGSIGALNLVEVMQAEELKDVSLCLSFEAISNYHFCHTMYNHLQGNAGEAWIHARSMYLMWQEYKGVQRIKAVEYRNVLQNYLSLSNEALRYDDFDRALEKLAAGPFRSEEDKVAAMHNSQYIRLQKHLNLCEWTNAKAVFDEFQQSREQLGDRMTPSRIMTFYLSFSRLFMVLGDWGRAVRWAKKVIQEGEGDANLGLVFQATLQKIVALYEQGDIDELQKKCRSAINRFKHLNPPRTFERKLISTLSKFASAQKPDKLRAALKDLLREMDGQRADKTQVDRLTRAWVIAKLHQEPLKNVLERQLQSDLEAK